MKSKVLDLTVIVPAYNEERRIKPFVNELFKACKSWKDFEIIFVDDGSIDNTLNILKEICKSRKYFRIISYKRNQGKGAAVQKGVMAARGENIIFIDADGSINPSLIPSMQRKLQKYDVVVGARSHKQSVVKKPIFRRFVSRTFNIYANILFGINIDDGLCGFKGFKANVARSIFKDLISKRWIFDIELFFKIRKMGFSLFEMPIHWVHRGQSKWKITDPLKIIIKLIKLRFELRG